LRFLLTVEGRARHACARAQTVSSRKINSTSSCSLRRYNRLRCSPCSLQTLLPGLCCSVRCPISYTVLRPFPRATSR